MISDSSELLTEIGFEILGSAPDGWESITVEAVGLGSGTDIEAIAHNTDGTQSRFLLGAKGNIACVKLRKAMYQPGTGTWYRARFAIDSSRQLNAAFDYDNPPFDEPLDNDIREILAEDHEMYPRDPEHLPRWHPAAEV